MKELKPMLQEGGPESMLRLLRAASTDAPANPDEKRERMLAAALASSPTHVPTPAKHAWWFAGGALVSVAAVGLWSALTPAVATRAPGAHVERASMIAAPVEAAWAALPVDSAPIESVPAVTASVHRVAPSAEVVLAAPAVGDPLALVDEARQLLAAGQPQGTLDRIRQYRAQFPTAGYRDEADALEIQALLRLGHEERARELGTRFLQERPTSPQAARIRRLLGTQP